MSATPILFSGPMIRALIEGRKTQTRRLAWRDAGFGSQDYASEQLEDFELRGWSAVGEGDEGLFRVYKPSRWQKARPGDMLWVREAWARTSIAPIVETIDNPWVVFREADNRCDYGGPWRSPLHLARRDSRLALEVTAVRIERLQEISEEDAKAEGCEPTTNANVLAPKDGFPSYRSAFALLWEALHGDNSWAENPEVVVISFKVHMANVDALLPSPEGREAVR